MELISDKELHELAGLVYAGEEDDRKEWIGTQQAWDKFKQLLKEHELHTRTD